MNYDIKCIAKELCEEWENKFHLNTLSPIIIQKIFKLFLILIQYKSRKTKIFNNQAGYTLKTSRFSVCIYD